MNERDIFDAALAITDSDERAAYLDGVCGEDVTQRSRLQELLDAQQRLGSFLDSPPPGVGATIDQPITEKTGTQIGLYKLLQKLGQGGMGVVFMAEQKTPVERRVALKIIKPGMDTRQVIARFEAERQALAMMDHPNIAKVLDAGTTDSGRPFFAMELVKGVPITQYCDEKRLTLQQRLELFVDACHAVQHAHQKGIIHRDIKPSNVMVAEYDDHAVPKIIDFGVAKAIQQQLTEKTMFTQVGQVVGTLEYMSPEQAKLNQLDIDTRSDIYSLGVLLYELLTGATPFDRQRLQSAAFDEMLRILREEEPPKPSTKLSSSETLPSIAANRHVEPKKLCVLIRGELDWIVMKALEKDRTRRYETANGFAADIQRFLSDKAVEACPPSTTYRFRKFARRNKRALATASMLTVALVLGMVGTAWQAMRANEQRDLAHIERDGATRLLASSYVDRAQALCEQGEIGRGMLWFAHSLQTAPSDADQLQQVIRTNLAVWGQQLHSLRMLLQLPTEVWTASFSPDGSRILTGCADGTIQLRDVTSGKPIGQPLQHDAWPKWYRQGQGPTVAFSPDGSRILTASYDGTAHLWDGKTMASIGEPLQHASAGETVKMRGRVRIAAFSPDGSRIVTASGAGAAGTVRLWDAATREPIGEPFQQGNPQTLRFCPDGLLVLTTTKSQRTKMELQLWNVELAQEIGPAIELGVFQAAAISPDGSLVAMSENDGGRIKLRQAATGQLAIPPIIHGGEVLALAFSPDGSLLLSGGNTRASVVWDVATGRAVSTPLRQQSAARCVAFSADGTRMVTGSDHGALRIWQLGSDQSVGKAIEHDDPIMAAAYSNEGLRILTERDALLQIRDAVTGNPLGKPFPRHAKQGRELMEFSPDGSRVLIREGFRGVVRDVATGESVGETFPVPNYLHCAVFSPDGSRVLFGAEPNRWRGGGFARVRDAITLNPLVDRLQHPATVSSVSFSPDGSRFLTGCFDGTTRLWDATTMQLLGQPLVHHSEVKDLAYSPAGDRMLIGFADGTARLWDLETLTPVGVTLHHKNIVSSVAFSPGGSRFVTCSLDETAQLWDAGTQKQIGPTLKHGVWWPIASFSTDGTRLIVFGGEGTDEAQKLQLFAAAPGPLLGDTEGIVRWVEVITGLELNENEGIGAFDAQEWQERYRRLQELGGPPRAASLPAPKPKPKTDFSRAMELALRGRERLASDQPDEAAADFARAIELSGNSPTLRRQIACWCQNLAAKQENMGHDGPLAAKAAAYSTELLEALKPKAPPLPAGITLTKMVDILGGSAGDGWARLFDGETLSGWQANENPATWTVMNGAVVCNGKRSHLFYVGQAEPFVNFEFVCEAMSTPGANSGIFFHTSFQKSGSPKRGYEAQVIASTGDPPRTGSLWGVVTVPDPPCQDNEYFTMHIIVQGTRIIIAVNGNVVVDYTEPKNKRRLGSGTFALQDWHGKAHFRNIFVKRLP